MFGVWLKRRLYVEALLLSNNMHSLAAGLTCKLENWSEVVVRVPSLPENYLNRRLHRNLLAFV